MTSNRYNQSKPGASTWLYVKSRFSLILLAILFVAILISGCAGMDARAKMAQTALKEKYGESFHVTKVKKLGAKKDYFMADAYAVAWPDLPFTLNMDMNNGTFQDGYVMKRGTHLMAERARQNISTLKNRYYVHVQSFFPDSVSNDQNISLEEYLSSESSNIFTFYLYLDPSGETAESISEAVSRIVDGMGTAEGSVEIFFADKAIMDKARRYVESHASLDDEYAKIGRHIHVVEVQYRSGRLELSQEVLASRFSSRDFR